MTRKTVVKLIDFDISVRSVWFVTLNLKPWLYPTAYNFDQYSK